MSDGTLTALIFTAFSIGFIHTLIGPDHYIPFVAMGKARNWSIGKTALITFLCGIGHVASSVVLGLIGIALGFLVGNLEMFEAMRGDIAGWGLLAFGFTYCVWGIRRAILNQPHSHLHVHDDHEHTHEHLHAQDHAHVHAEKGKADITPWILFTVFVLGPCEPLIPILMYPAAEMSLLGLSLVTAAFSVATIGTMLIIVVLASLGLKPVVFAPLARYSHALAGGTILLCGLAIKLGL